MPRQKMYDNPKALAAALTKLPVRASAEQILRTFANAGVKVDEMKWLGLDDLLARRMGTMVDRDQIVKLIQVNDPEIKETTIDDREQRKREAAVKAASDARADARHKLQQVTAEYQREMSAPIDGPIYPHMDRLDSIRLKYKPLIDQYRQQVLHHEMLFDMARRNAYQPNYKAPKYKEWSMDGGENYREMLFRFPNHAISDSPHWPGHKNVFAHVRMSDMTGPEGKILHLDELQSDVHQKGAEEAPFSKTWHELLIRRMLKYAAQKGYAAVSLVRGEDVSKRFGLDRHFSSITLSPADEENHVFLSAVKHTGRAIDYPHPIPMHRLHEYVGHEVADKIIPQYQGKHVTIVGDDLKSTNVGKQQFYDQILPQYMDKIGRKFGSRVGQTKLDNGHTVHYLPITEQMRKELRSKPVVKFKRS